MVNGSIFLVINSLKMITCRYTPLLCLASYCFMMDNFCSLFAPLLQESSSKGKKYVYILVHNQTKDGDSWHLAGELSVAFSRSRVETKAELKGKPLLGFYESESQTHLQM